MKRRESIDAFRGLTIIGMILVNNPGSWNHVYQPLLHAHWNGCTLADLVFPFFLFIVGVSIVFAYTKYLQKGITKSRLIRKAFIRTLILFGIGVLLNFIMSNFQELRIPGVLQRIAIVYFITTVLFLYADKRLNIIILFILLAGYWMLLVWIPPPGQIKALLEPGMNIVNWIDFKIIPGKLYQNTWDPEGLLSTLPAIATCITGLFAGWIMITTISTGKQLRNLTILGVTGIILGLGWNLVFPINKNLWTSSYVLYTSGFAFLLLALFEVLFQTSRSRNWLMIFLMPGTNAITIYVFHILLFYPLCMLSFGDVESIKALFIKILLNIDISLKLVSLFWAIFYTLLCIIPAWILYRNRIFIKV